MRMLFLAILFCSALSANAQITFEKTYGGDDEDRGNAVFQSRNGGYVVAGLTGSFGNGGQAYLIKTDATGDTIWTRHYGGSLGEEAYAALETRYGHILIGGVNSSYNPTDGEMFLIKVDGANGDTLWDKIYEYSGYQRLTDMDSTFDGGYILAGYYSSGYSDFMLMKVDSLGSPEWEYEYGPAGWSYEYAYGVKQTSDSGFVVVGSGNTPFNDKYIYLVKTDADGDTMWTRRIHGDYAYDIVQTQDNGYFMVGRINRYYTGVDIYLVRTDENGDTLWTRTYGTASLDIARAVQMTPDNGFIITGESDYSVFILKAESNGDSSWMYTYGTGMGDYGNDIQIAEDGGYIITGGQYAPDGDDVYLIKTNPDGLVPVISGKYRSVAGNYQLHQNYPNPFNPATIIRYNLPERAEVIIRIFDINGREVRTLVKDMRPAGEQSVIWNGTDNRGLSVSSGIYLYQLKTGRRSESRRMLLLR